MYQVTADCWLPLVLVLLPLPLLNCHPQCLDFRAPFQPNKNLTFCQEYSSLGCCGSRDDRKVREEFQYIRSRVPKGDWICCRSYVKTILCQKCSPYAAHLYDAEGNSKARQFPGLCQEYCQDLVRQCWSLIPLLIPGFEESRSSWNKSRFCQQTAIPDLLYCYPDLLKSPLLKRNLTSLQALNDTTGCLCLERVGDNLANPLWARHAGDGSGRLFVAEQKGRVRIFNVRTKTWARGCFMDFIKKTEVGDFPGDERGFLGMAFHPNYSKNGRIFVYYSTGRPSTDQLPPEYKGRDFPFESKIVISEVRVSSSDPNKVDPGFERILLEVVQPYDNHNGGELMFALDGYLYAFIGDGGGAGDPMEAGQNKSLLLGKVIRVDVDSDPSQPYTIPPDNPFLGESRTRPEIFAYGVRNIWRCGLDTGGESRGRILCGDVGQNAFEEIDILKKGANYGWHSREGFTCYDKQTCGRIGAEELPIHAYGHAVGQSVTGGVFYRGCENPALVGQYIYGDYSSSRIFSLTESQGDWTNRDVHLCGPTLCQGGLVGTLNEHILSFGEDEFGEIYMLTSRSSSSTKCDGHLYKITDPIRRNDPSMCRSELTRNKRVPLSVMEVSPSQGTLFSGATKVRVVSTQETGSQDLQFPKNQAAIMDGPSNPIGSKNPNQEQQSPSWWRDGTGHNFLHHTDSRQGSLVKLDTSRTRPGQETSGQNQLSAQSTSQPGLARQIRIGRKGPKGKKKRGKKKLGKKNSRGRGSGQQAKSPGTKCRVCED